MFFRRTTKPNQSIQNQNNNQNKKKDPDFKPVAKRVLEDFKRFVEEEGAGGAPGYTLDPVNHEGWRVNVDEGDGEQDGDGGDGSESGGKKRGWALLRASLHDPLLVLNIESDVEGGAGRIGAHLKKAFLERHAEALDLSALSDL